VGLNAMHSADLYAAGVLHTYAWLDDDISHVPEGYHAPYMPESEPKPKPLESIPAGSAQGWKAVLKSGKQVVVHEIPVPPAAAAVAVRAIQRLATHPHPPLSRSLAWGTAASAVWIAVGPKGGPP